MVPVSVATGRLLFTGRPVATDTVPEIDTELGKMPTAKFTAEPGTPEYQASEWLMTIHNAYREIDQAILQSPDPAAFIERLRERVRRDYEQNREQMGWTERTRDIAERSLNVVLETLKLPNV
jgi:hypothetical protein